MRRRLLKPPRKLEQGHKPLGMTTTLNKRLIKQICDLAEMGRTIDSITDFLGISSQNFWRWMRKGEKYLNGNYKPKEYYIFGLFVVRLRKSLALYRFNIQDKLHSAGKGTWIKFMAILERRDRKNFSRTELPGGGEESYDSDERFV